MACWKVNLMPKFAFNLNISLFDTHVFLLFFHPRDLPLHGTSSFVFACAILHTEAFIVQGGKKMFEFFIHKMVEYRYVHTTPTDTYSPILFYWIDWRGNSGKALSKVLWACKCRNWLIGYKEGYCVRCSLKLFGIIFCFRHPGALATVGALSYGLYSFIRGDAQMQQYMMRSRVAAQGGTLIAVIVGVTYMLYKDRNKNWIA